MLRTFLCVDAVAGISDGFEYIEGLTGFADPGFNVLLTVTVCQIERCRVKLRQLLFHGKLCIIMAIAFDETSQISLPSNV